MNCAILRMRTASHKNCKPLRTPTVVGPKTPSSHLQKQHHLTIAADYARTFQNSETNARKLAYTGVGLYKCGVATLLRDTNYFSSTEYQQNGYFHRLLVPRRH